MTIDQAPTKALPPVMPDPDDDPLILLLLTALPGAGKSTLAHTLVSTGDWIRASQDDAPRRRRQEAEDSVRQGLRLLAQCRNRSTGELEHGLTDGQARQQSRTGLRGVIVDRCDFDSSQRSHFIRIAREPEFLKLDVQVWCLVLIVPYDILLHRLHNRPPHPTINPTNAAKVLNMMSRDFRPPVSSVAEGIDRVLVIKWDGRQAGGASDWGSRRAGGIESRRFDGVPVESEQEAGWTTEEAVKLVERIGRDGWTESASSGSGLVASANRAEIFPHSRGGYVARGRAVGLERGGHREAHISRNEANNSGCEAYQGSFAPRGRAFALERGGLRGGQAQGPPSRWLEPDGRGGGDDPASRPFGSSSTYQARGGYGWRGRGGQAEIRVRRYGHVPHSQGYRTTAVHSVTDHGMRQLPTRHGEEENGPSILAPHVIEKPHPHPENSIVGESSMEIAPIPQPPTAAVALTSSTCEISTPKYGKLHDSVYDPAEDTFILLDALERDACEIRALDPLICLEIGSGSGVVTAFLAEILKTGSRSNPEIGLWPTVLLTTDLNPDALTQTASTYALNNPKPIIPLLSVRTDLLSGLEERLIAMGGIGLGFFNPPYVPTDDEELAETQDAGGIGATWAGGRAGMEVTNVLLEMLPGIIAPAGRFYLVAVADNDPQGIMKRTNAETAATGLTCEIVLKRRAGREHLHVLRFVKI